MMKFNRQAASRTRQQKIAELRDQLRFAMSEQKRRTLDQQTDAWQQQP